MNDFPLLCPRCGRPQRVLRQDDPHRPVRVVHTETGRETCADEDEPASEPPTDPERSGLDRC
ncbi:MULTISPECIES: hypothetical protein [Kitasatospora]|uniref:Uncharacterized protein n=1 Tax=Kitasatospora setae (strain ATCC 33774 / DSM 43861 / JCM 3304 / KCC A-0304 / NBRC 14216 / KM-6054) TaxID=452652 RepID=E4N8Y2_KITSK|nr:MULTISPECIES: hypothetical protein [Kitasatospora]BAJ27663.1 hypothetical protein KSE_18380 [Kitasatospora setae KM-6054]